MSVCDFVVTVTSKCRTGWRGRVPLPPTMLAKIFELISTGFDNDEVCDQVDRDWRMVGDAMICSS